VTVQHVDGGWLIKTVGGYRVLVKSLLGCARIVCQHVDDPPNTPTAYWCYYGPARVTAAMLAAQAWDGRLGTAPAGAQRSYDGRTQLVSDDVDADPNREHIDQDWTGP